MNNRNEAVMSKLWMYFCTSILISPLSVASAYTKTIPSEEQHIMEYLAELNFSELQKVEISLDETFDVFAGLVKQRHTEVATGVKQSTQRAPAVTSIITAQDIEVMGVRTLQDVLQTVPGIQTSYNWYNVPIYTIRGVSSENNPEVLFLINGTRFNNVRLGAKSGFWGNFPVNTIARIEIIRGPGSAVYGADAFAGVINIITKTAKDIEGTEVGARLGSFNTQDGWILHGHTWKGFEIAAMLNFNHTDGHQRIVKSDAQTVLDQQLNTQASLAPGPYNASATDYNMQLDVIKNHWQFQTSVSKTNDGGLGVGVGQALDNTQDAYEQRFTIDLMYHNSTLSDHWAVDARLHYLLFEFGGKYKVYPPGAFGGMYPLGVIIDTATVEAQTQYEISGLYSGLNSHLLRIGAGHAYYDTPRAYEAKNFGIHPLTGTMISPLELVNVTDTSSISQPKTSRTLRYVFLQDTWTLNPQWELTTGLRYDWYSDFSSVTTPRLGLVWEPQTDLAIKLLYGRAFRTPSFNELYSQNNPVMIGNPKLKPEKNETWELAFSYHATDKLHLALNLFHYKIKDKIILTPYNDSDYGFANETSWQGQGSEFELRWKTSDRSSVLFNYSYQHTEDKTTKVILHNGSQHTAYLRGDYLLGSKWYVDSQIHWVSDWPRAPNDSRPKLKGYNTVNLILRRKDIRAGRTNFALGIRNLFDTDVRYPSPGPDTKGILNVPNDLPGAGRFYFAEFRYQF